ncbi:hypothetical protein, partial [Mobilibacterium timonense]|uniref:hypothetical protein n=1 Tax=Mobilibacterium timonense TaxID=1871012 RepID=UPI003A93742E
MVPYLVGFIPFYGEIFTVFRRVYPGGTGKRAFGRPSVCGKGGEWMGGASLSSILVIQKCSYAYMLINICITAFLH